MKDREVSIQFYCPGLIEGNRTEEESIRKSEAERKGHVPEHELQLLVALLTS